MKKKQMKTKSRICDFFSNILNIFLNDPELVLGVILYSAGTESLSTVDGWYWLYYKLVKIFSASFLLFPETYKCHTDLPTRWSRCEKQSADKSDKSVFYKDPCCHCECDPRQCSRTQIQKHPLQGELTGKLLQLDTDDSWKSLESNIHSAPIDGWWKYSELHLHFYGLKASICSYWNTEAVLNISPLTFSWILKCI